MKYLAGRRFVTFFIPRSAFIIAFFLVPACVCAQVVRLPAVDPTEASPAGQLVSHPDSTEQSLQTPGETSMAPPAPSTEEPKLPPGVRNGVFQKALFTATWLAPGGTDGFGDTDLDLQGIFAVPCPTIQSPLVMTPGFGVQYLEGPKNLDLPSHLYDAYFQFRWMSQVTPSLGLDFAVTPGVYSDFEQSSSKAFRLTGHAAAAWTWSEQLKIAAGAAYLDMPSDTNVIPIGGLIWKPNEDWQFDLVFPYPKAARRINWNGNQDPNVQDWFYISGEFTNDAWAIEQNDGTNCQVSLRDYRVILGVERKVLGGLSSRIEIGYVFGRRIRYTNDTPDFFPSDTVMVRGGLTY